METDCIRPVHPIPPRLAREGSKEGRHTPFATQRILRGEEPAAAGGHRRAVLVAVGIRGFRSLLSQLAPPQIVALLDQYGRAIANSMAHRGGVIDSIVGDSALVYFAGAARTCPASIIPANSSHNVLLITIILPYPRSVPAGTIGFETRLRGDCRPESCFGAPGESVYFGGNPDIPEQ